MIIKAIIVCMTLVGITFVLTEAHRYMVYKAEIEQGMSNDRREVKHG